ncbi:hypothetical protein TNCV_4001271 [Trichonephila clavipes]|uniref:Uncharacterized protein n=1 Tax=Trichonephila clavipes TaxID=2585209 RepID=A0A8X6V8H6_TRICX|nr:hypothetical protein TNCV_4001271 [Trichonephila clavipes]
MQKTRFQMLYDDEIVTFVQEESDLVDDEADEDEDNNNKESSKGPSNAEMFSTLETAMERYEQQSEWRPTPLLLLKRIKRHCTKIMKVYNGVDSDPGEGMDVYKRTVPLWQVSILNSHRATSPLTRSVEEEEKWEALPPPGCSSKFRWNRAESYCLTMLKATDNH